MFLREGDEYVDGKPVEPEHYGKPAYTVFTPGQGNFYRPVSLFFPATGTAIMNLEAYPQAKYYHPDYPDMTPEQADKAVAGFAAKYPDVVDAWKKRRASEPVFPQVDAQEVIAKANALEEGTALVVALLEKCHDVLSKYLAPDGDARQTVETLLGLLDSPEQRVAQSKAERAVRYYKSYRNRHNINNSTNDAHT